jgi:hypothetical protein
MDNGSVFDLIFSCFNQYLFQDAKNNILDLQYYFQTNPQTAGNGMVSQLVDAIKTYPLENIDEPLFRSILFRSQKTPQETQEVMNEIIKWKRYTKSQIEPARKILTDVIYSVNLQKANRLYSQNPEEYVKFVKNMNLQFGSSGDFNAISLNNLDINSIIAEDSNNIIPSRYDWINDTFPNGGFEKGQLLLFSAPPGSGKSLYALSELSFMAANGFSCLYLAMGDLSYKDQIVRLGAMTTGLTFGEVYKNLGPIYNSMSQLYGDRLDLSIVSADQITAQEIKDFVKNSKKKYDAIAVDYDSNIKSTNMSDSMYLEFGSIYSVLVDIAKELNMLVLVLGQPKVGVWNNPTIELSDVGESSRKQHMVDFCLTRSRIPDCPNNLGIFKIVKSRRGDVGKKVYSIRLNNSRFIELPKGVFDQLRSETERRDYTEGDIQMMIQAYSRQYANIQHQVNNSISNNINKQQVVSGPTPFSKP